MKYYTKFLWVFFILASLGLVGGVIAKVTGLIVLTLAPISYLRFTAVCLLFIIALSLTQISLTNK